MTFVQHTLLILALALGASIAQAADPVWEALKTSGSVVVSSPL